MRRQVILPLAMSVLIIGFVGFGYVLVGRGKHRQELQRVYENYLAAKAQAYENFDVSLLKDTTTNSWANTLHTHLKTLEQWGIVRREKWELMSFRVMEYTAGSHAQIRSTRKYLVLGDEGNFKEYPDYYWRTETQVCDLVWEAEKWKIDECRYVISDW